MSKKPEMNYSAERWKELKKSVKPKKSAKPKTKTIYGNSQDEKKPGEVLTDASKQKKDK